MNNAVAIVQAYLHLCGYFTVTEYPVMEALRGGSYRMATDLDVLAVRFPAAQHVVPKAVLRHGAQQTEIEPVHETGDDRIDMIIGEVKEGRAELNDAARNPATLRTVLSRFGCCEPDQVERAIEQLLSSGHTEITHGSTWRHHARLVAFGSREPKRLDYPCEIVLLGEIIDSVRSYLREHWDIVRHAQFKDPALAMLCTLEKASEANRSE